MKLSASKACGALACLSSVEAFMTPTSTFSRAASAASRRTQATSSTAVRMVGNTGSEFASSLPGAPFGMAAEGNYFDPIGLAKKQDPAVVKKWREAELKHGRVAMLAALGILVAEVRHDDL